MSFNNNKMRFVPSCWFLILVCWSLLSLSPRFSVVAATAAEQQQQPRKKALGWGAQLQQEQEARVAAGLPAEVELQTPYDLSRLSHFVRTQHAKRDEFYTQDNHSQNDNSEPQQRGRHPLWDCDPTDHARVHLCDPATL